ncbi:SDR family NAD(P)-dependent oxidoreductase [Paenibacillus ehimensis]|uniref:SDR family NAD(P)-dependent oxidoreductase n=2 Tax=Paenibacillus ehimensis TaxID=79264 RepID=A0ABT8VAF4_9BACL|nr:SDR family NAD(P)-dependent oxidoreductase [Paenibacillus ehimensis]MDO3677966.1 SDR family NAD(P)-dependent oxidoreductase [Paenibacillus ehimensis]
MKIIVITGGTDGIGKGLAMDSLKKGNTVVVIGRNHQKGQHFLEDANKIGAIERAFFFQADLSLVMENKRIVAEIESRFPTVDALILCAQHYRSERGETIEGFEKTFALYYLSRFILSYGLKNLMENADKPSVINVCAPGIEVGKIYWNDLQLTRNYSGLEAMMQSSRLNDLLGIGFAENDKINKIKYILFNPGGVSTSFSGEYDEVMKNQIVQIKKSAKPVQEGIKPIVKLLEKPPIKSISANMEGNEISLEHESFDRENAIKLFNITKNLL